MSSDDDDDISDSEVFTIPVDPPTPDEISASETQRIAELGAGAGAASAAPTQMHGEAPPSTANLRIFCGTWNLGLAPPPEALEAFIPTQGRRKCELVAIGVQECWYQARPQFRDDESLIGKLQGVMSDARLLDSQLAADWFGTLKHHMGTEYQLVGFKSLWGIRLAIYAHTSIASRVHSVRTGSVATGVGNVLGNKGGVGVSLVYEGLKLAFVTAHLAAHQDMTVRRNQDYQAIAAGLALGEAGSATDLLTDFHHVFFFGDFNYRLEFNNLSIRKPPRETFNAMVDLIERREFATLLSTDQLVAQQAYGRAFEGFVEAPLCFAPTYKVVRDQALEYTNKRAPAWCDRVMWRSLFGHQVGVEETWCAYNIMTSDHKPVATILRVPRKPLPAPPAREADRGRFRRYVVRLMNLHCTDLVPSEFRPDRVDAYLRIGTCRGNHHAVRLPTVPATREPLWEGETAVVLSRFVDSLEELRSVILRVFIHDDDGVPPNQVLGRVAVPLDAFVDVDEPMTRYCGFVLPIMSGGRSAGLLVGKVKIEEQHKPDGNFSRCCGPCDRTSGAAAAASDGIGATLADVGTSALSKAKNMAGRARTLVGKAVGGAAAAP